MSIQSAYQESACSREDLEGLATSPKAAARGDDFAKISDTGKSDCESGSESDWEASEKPQHHSK